MLGGDGRGLGPAEPERQAGLLLSSGSLLVAILLRLPAGIPAKRQRGQPFLQPRQ